MSQTAADSPPQFTLLAKGVPLYRTDPPPAPDAPQLYYALMGKPATFPDAMDAEAAWENMSGGFLFLPPGASIPDPSGLVETLGDVLKPLFPHRQWLVWLASGDKQAVSDKMPWFSVNKGAGKVEGAVAATTDLAFYNLSIQLTVGLKVRADFDRSPPAFTLVPSQQAGTTIVLQQSDGGASLPMPSDATMGIPLAGPQQGLCCFPLNSDRGLFYALFTPTDGSEMPPASAECRFGFGPEESPTRLRFPLLLGAEPNPIPPPKDVLPLLVTIDPLAPGDGARTRFAFDLPQYGGSGPVLPVSDSLRTTAGATLTLTPQQGGGYGLGLRPDGAGGTAAYLTPAGPYEIGVPETLRAMANPPLANGAIELMCGVYGTEFLLVADRDVIDFTGSDPAFAPHFQVEPTDAERSVGPLDDRLTTGWVSLIPGPNSGKVFPGQIKQSYCAQAFGSVYYQTQPGEDAPLPIAIGARIADVSDPEAGQTLPAAPLGRVYYSDDIIENPNPDIPASTLIAFDNSVLSRARFASLAPDRCLGPLFFDMAKLEALSGGYVRTPQGLLVSLNDGPMEGDDPSGTWKELLLARSPEDEDQLLRFVAGTEPSGCQEGTGPFDVVSPYLSTALMDPAAVLFIAQPDYLGTFESEIQLGEFPIRIDVSNSDTGSDLGGNCVMIMKFATDRSIADLAADPTSWGSQDYMSGDPAIVTRLSAQIVEAIKEAKAESAAARKAKSYDYFADFLARVGDPGWTGILALNPPLDQQSLPADIQMLLCGMRQGQGLRCHHFGITTNAAPGSGSSAEAIDKSALFALIHYNADFDSKQVSTPYDFQTLRLNVLFDNSLIKHFDSRIAVSVRDLLGNPAALTTYRKNDIPASNTIVIDGVLQVADGVTRVVFVSDKSRGFTFPTTGNQYRVLETQAVDEAGLAPVTQDDDSDSIAAGDNATVTVTAQFSMDGSFGFTTRSLGSGNPADLFSYGIDEEGDGGLGYSAYILTMVSQVPPSGATPPPVISLTLDGLLLDTSDGDPREDSLIATLPLKVAGFTANPGARKSTNVSGIGIDGATPVYAIATELMMGTLGGLDDAGPLQGQLLLGWAPGGDKARPDKTGVLLAAPPAMSDGSFKLQGVIPSTYGPVELLRPKLDGDDVYVLVLRQVRFMLGALPLAIPQTGERSLTFFGRPPEDDGETAGDEDEDEVTLSWFLGEPDLSNSQTLAEPAIRIETDSELNVVPAVYVVAGLKVEYDQQASQIVDTIIWNLSQVPLSTKETLDKILAGDDNIPVNYDPNAGVTVAVDLTFGPVAFQFVFSDPYVYGGYISISKEDDDDDDDDDGKDEKALSSGEGTAVNALTAAGTALKKKKNGNGKEEKKGILDSLDGFELEIAYRKISPGLGAWSVVFTISGQIGTDDYYLMLPTIGLVIYTNGDFRIDIGWPFSPEGGWVQPIAVQFSIEGVPLRATAGLYLAKLRSADCPDELGDKFAVIWRFGLGLSFGINKDIDKGPLSLSVGLIAFVTFEGFLASEHGNLTENGVDYKWFAGQLGVRAYFIGEVDLKVVSIAVSAVATLVLEVAYETDHTTVIQLKFYLSIYVSFRIVFVTISFSFDAELSVFPPIRIGSGPDASIDGPDPTGVYARQRLVEAEAPRLLKAIDSGLLERVGTAPVGIPLYLVLQPAVVNAPDGKSAAPQAVATLMINLVPDQGESDDFSRFATVLADWLVANYGGSGSLTDQLARVASALNAGAADDAVQGFLAGSFTFTLLPSGAMNKAANFAAFPMLSPLMLDYGSTDIPFNGPPVPSGYPQALSDYFRQLSARPKNGHARLAAAAGQSAAEIVCGDMVVMIGKQLVSQLQDIAADNPKMSLADALQALGPGGFANVAGFASRFAYHGVRLPTPDSKPFGSTLEALYSLTGQQVPLVQDSGSWQTAFTLGFAPGEAPGWIKFGPDGTDKSISDKLDPNTVLTQPVVPAWLGSGSGLVPLAPVRTDPTLFFAGQPIAWTRADGSDATILPFGDALANRLAAFTAGGGIGATATLNQIKAAPSRSLAAKLAGSPSIDSTAILFVPLRLRQIVPPEGGSPLENVFQLVGTDDGTREKLERLVRSPVAGVTLSFLLANGGIYASSANTAAIVLAKANLSTLNEPPVMLAEGVRAKADQPPVSATLGDVQPFLTLVWEESVVHSGGFYAYLPNIPSEAFANGQAQAALVVQRDAAGANVALHEWSNNFLVAPPRNRNDGAVVATVGDAGGTWSQANPNHASGLAGFAVNWPQPPSQPGLDGHSSPADKAAYGEALYSLLQYQVVSLNGAPNLPSHWSRPVGPNQEAAGTDWHFTATVDVANLLGAANRYAGIGETVTFGVTLLDLYGNALPPAHDVDVPVVYNDPLMATDQWPGARAYYAFSAGDPGKVTLTLSVDFDPSRLGTGPQTDKDPAVLASALAGYQQVHDQLTDRLQAGKPDAGACVSTIFAPQPLTRTSDGSDLTQMLADWVGRVIGWLEAAIGGVTGPVPLPVQPVFTLDQSAASGLPSDLTPLEVQLLLRRDPATVDPKVAAALPSVAWVASTLGAAQDLAPKILAARDDGPDLRLLAFAEAFENAWYGFDGGTAQLKLAQGIAGEAAPDAAPLPLWFVRVGKGAGIGVTFENAGLAPPAALPATFAPPPLSTLLLSQTFKVRTYKSEWSGDASDVVLPDQDHVFTNIDLTAWAVQFLAATEGLFGPEMASAIAKLDPGRYASLAAQKQALADGIAPTLAAVLEIPGQTPGTAAPVERFRQALLNNLSSAYGLAAVVSLPADVQLAGNDEPDAPPNYYGRPTGPGLQDPSGRQPFTLSPAALGLTTGMSPLVYLVSSRTASARAWLDVPMTYDVAFLEHDFRPDERIYGYEPSSWLSFVAPAFKPSRGGSQGGQALSLALGRNAIPLPLRVYPPMPAISVQAAAVPSDPATLADALCWSYNCTIATPQAAQDQLLLNILLNDPPTGSAGKAEAALSLAAEDGADPPRPDPKDLFEALARFSFEYPELAPHLVDVPKAAFAGGDAKVARRALERFDYLITWVANTWPAWVNPGLTPMARFHRDLDAPPPVDRAIWSYAVDFSGLPALAVTRSMQSGSALPPWPDIEGFVTPGDHGQARDVYKPGAQPPPEGAPLAFTFGKLPATAAQSAHVTASVTRNSNLVPPGMPAGTKVNPAFVYTTPLVEAKDPVVPLLDLPSQLFTVGAGSASLSTAIDAFLQPFLASSSLAGLKAREISLQLAGAYYFRLAQGGRDQDLESGNRIFLTQSRIALESSGADDDPITPAVFKQNVLGALTGWHKAVQPSDDGATIQLPVTLYAVITDQLLPLVRLGDVRIDVPHGRPSWWQ